MTLPREDKDRPAGQPGPAPGRVPTPGVDDRPSPRDAEVRGWLGRDIGPRQGPRWGRDGSWRVSGAGGSVSSIFPLHPPTPPLSVPPCLSPARP